MMDNVRLVLVRRPGDGEHIEPRGASEEAVGLQEVQREIGQALLLDVVHRSGGTGGVGRFRGAHLDEYDAAMIERDEIKLAVRTGVIAGQNAVAATPKK